MPIERLLYSFSIKDGLDKNRKKGDFSDENRRSCSKRRL